MLKFSLTNVDRREKKSSFSLVLVQLNFLQQLRTTRKRKQKGNRSSGDSEVGQKVSRAKDKLCSNARLARFLWKFVPSEWNTKTVNRNNRRVEPWLYSPTTLIVFAFFLLARNRPTTTLWMKGAMEKVHAVFELAQARESRLSRAYLRDEWTLCWTVEQWPDSLHRKCKTIYTSTKSPSSGAN